VSVRTKKSRWELDNKGLVGGTKPVPTSAPPPMNPAPVRAVRTTTTRAKTTPRAKSTTGRAKTARKAS
jgi:hypothetical protein